MVNGVDCSNGKVIVKVILALVASVVMVEFDEDSSVKVVVSVVVSMVVYDGRRCVKVIVKVTLALVASMVKVEFDDYCSV